MGSLIGADLSLGHLGGRYRGGGRLLIESIIASQSAAG
jgi:hypothetical protein